MEMYEKARMEIVDIVDEVITSESESDASYS